MKDKIFYVILLVLVVLSFYLINTNNQKSISLIDSKIDSLKVENKLIINELNKMTVLYDSINITLKNKKSEIKQINNYYEEKNDDILNFSPSDDYVFFTKYISGFNINK